nr:hypothetical protein [Tanacetum cinerariifolium]
VLMIDWLSIVETDKVIHTVETDIVKLVVEIESFGMIFDKFDEETGSFDGLQPKQANLSCVHALNELHLHEIRVVPRCALLREKLEEDLVTYLKYFPESSESSDDSTNVVNAPREPFVVKQDHGVKSSQNPPPIDKCCCECGNALDGIFCQQCICKSCGKGAHTGYNCPPKVPRSTTKDKGKGIMQETELPRKIKKREMIQLSLDEELAQKLHAEELAKETARQEHERVFFKAKVRKNMCTYLKNRGGYKQSYFKGMKYTDIRPIFERVWDQIHTFVPKDSEIEKEVMKRSGFNLQQESSKKQKLDEQTEEEAEAQADIDQEIKEMKLFVKVVPDEDIAIDAIPLATKPPVIVEYKIVKEGKISTYHIRRADGSTKRYTSMIKLLENIDREDLETI